MEDRGGLERAEHLVCGIVVRCAHLDVARLAASGRPQRLIFVLLLPFVP